MPEEEGWLRKREDKCEMRELDSKLKLNKCPPDFANVPLKIRLGDTGVPQKFGPRHNTVPYNLLYNKHIAC